MTNFDTKKTYHNVMERFKFGGISEPGVYVDETVMRMCYTHRRLMVKLAMNLAIEGDTIRAAEVLDRADKEFPTCNVPHDFQSYSIEMAQTYAAIGQADKARDITNQLWKKSSQYMTFYNSLDKGMFKSCESNCQLHMFYIMRRLINIADMIDTNLADSYESELAAHLEKYISKGGSIPER